MLLFHRYRGFLLFLLKLGVLCAIYFLWFKPNAWTLPVVSTYYCHLHHYTLKFLMEPSAWVLNSVGIDAVVVNLRHIHLPEHSFWLNMLNPCLGIDMMFAIGALIISFPGKWLDRLWFIPLGLIGIHTVNIARVVGLCLSWVKWQGFGPIEHHDLYDFFATLMILFFFILWIKRNQGALNMNGSIKKAGITMTG